MRLKKCPTPKCTSTVFVDEPQCAKCFINGLLLIFGLVTCLILGVHVLASLLLG